MSSKIADSNMAYLGLNEAQYAEFSKLMQGIDNWDAGLKRFVQARCKELGFCGDVFATAVADWVKTQEVE